MIFARLCMHLLEILFFVGIIGSSVVVIITSFEDAHELLERHDDPAAASDKTAAAS